MKRPLIAAALCLFLSSGVLRPLHADSSAGANPPVSANRPAQAAPLDDQWVQEHIIAEAAKLGAANKVVKASALVEQLKTRPNCAIALAKPSAQPIPASEYYARLRQSVLVMGGTYLCSKCGHTHVITAAGYPIAAHGVCVTNYHVVNNTQSEALFAMTPEGRVMNVKEVLAASETDDVAIVQLDGDGLTPLPLVADAPVGSRVRVISHPNSAFYTMTEGIVSRYFLGGKRKSAGAPKSAGVPKMAITADYARGSSGAPVLDDCGSVTGMVASTMSVYYSNDHGRQENLQMVVKECVPAASILRLIKER
jgi:serine protease Do